MEKSYLNQRTSETTERATVALQWHKRGDIVQVCIFDKRGTLADFVAVPGATIETGREKSERENREICKRYADDLADYADGIVHTCRECRETVYIPDDAPRYRCPCCGNTADRDDYIPQTLYDYLSECLDIEFRIGSDKTYRSAEICLAWGGPNVYVDTAENAVKLFWGGDRETYYISGALSDEIDDVCEMQYDCM